MIIDKPAPQVTDKRRLRGAKSRRNIVGAAISCIATQGLRSTTIEQIARRAKVSRALVVFHYKSKTGVLTAVLNHLHEIYAQGWNAALANAGAAHQRLLSAIEYDLEFAREQPDLLSVWHAFWGEARGSSLYRELSHPHDKRYAADLAALLEELVEQGGYQDVDIDAVETGISAMLFGLWRNTHLLHESDDSEKGLRAFHVYLHSLFPDHY